MTMQPEQTGQAAGGACRRCCTAGNTRCGVLAARAAATDEPAASDALAAFVAQAWREVHAVARRHASRTADAEDLTQGYFLCFLEKDYLRRLETWRGCVRPFLLTSARHFVANARDHERAAKRGGGLRTLSLDAPAAGCCRDEPRDERHPELLLDRAERQRALERAVHSLASAPEKPGRRRSGPLLQLLLDADTAPTSVQIAREWGTSDAAVRVALHRLRRRLARAVASELDGAGGRS
jgi:RNA polymerase sigma-70 factor (ECF subfamily)